MRLPRPALVLLGLVLAGPALLSAQDQPLAAGSEGVPVPKKKKHVQPVYPPEALAQGIRGIVILDLVIDTEGRVAETTIIRSIPGLDEAALVAAQQWVYEPVEVDGEPVSVRLTVPITFALKLPEMTRQDGIPELRQGVTPPWPRDAGGGGEAVATVTLEPDGRIGLARIVEGEEPWSTSLLQALRTWRFRAPADDVSVSFRVEAEFLPGGSGTGDVELRLTGLNETALLDAPATGEDIARAEPVPEGAAPESEPEEIPVTEPALPEERLEAAPSDRPPTTSAPEVPESEPTGPETQPEGAPEPATAPAPSPPAPSPELPEPTATPTTPGPPPEPEPGAGSSAPAPEETTEPPAEASPAAPESAPAPVVAAAPTPTRPGTPPPPNVDPTASPPVEVLTAAPPPLPPENGISAIRGVELEPGVPDLTRGRRPVSPPFARMARASGVVTVDFSVSAGGITAVQRAEGPELFRPAAVQAVESWVFRRTRADRAYLIAEFKYEDDLASAVVRPQRAP